MPMVPNMIDNSFFNERYDVGALSLPNGYTTSSYGTTPGTIDISCVHPYTKGFEGPYCPLNDGGCPTPAATINEATESTPWIFGHYQKGARAGRGGLGDGWAGRSDGKLLKLTGTRLGGYGNNQVRVNFPKEGIALTSKVLFRGFLKIIKGKANVQTDVGNYPRWTREQTEAAPDGWLSIHELIGSSHVTSLDSVHVLSFNCYGENVADGSYEERNTGDFEMYLALPYMANIVETNDDETSPHWHPSIMDNNIFEGLAKWDVNDVVLNQ
jgi:hypothetical protein